MTIGYNVIGELLTNPNQYDLGQSNFIKRLQSLVLNITPSKVKGIVKLIQTQNKDNFSSVKTPTNPIHITGCSSITVPCRANTEPMTAKSPAILEAKIAGNLLMLFKFSQLS